MTRLFTLPFTLFQAILMTLLLVIQPVSTSLAADAVQNTHKVSVQLNWNHQFQFAGFYAAQKQGFYRDEGLKVEVKPWRSGLNTLNEVVQGRADFGVGYSSIIADYVKGAPIKLVMSPFQFSPMVLLSHEPVDGLDALFGKTLMTYDNLPILGILKRLAPSVRRSLTIIPATGDLNNFIDRKVDFYAAYTTNEPQRLRNKKIPFYVLDPKRYGVQTYGDFIFTSRKKVQFEHAEVQKFKAATIKGWAYAIEHQAEIVDYILANYQVVKSREDLLNEARATTQFIKSGDIPIGDLNASKLLSNAAEAKEAGLITQAQFDTLDIKSLVFDNTRYMFTDEEFQYLATHPVVRLANDIDWEPFEYIDKQGQYQGIAADYFTLLSRKLGIQFVPNRTLNWSETVEKAKAGELDVYSCAVATPKRKAYMQFTQPYLSFPMVLASRKDIAFVEDYKELNGKKVAVVKDYWSHENLVEHYPNIQLVLVNSVKEGLDAVIEGRAEMYSGNLGAINFTLHKFGITGIHIVGQSDYRFELAMGVAKSNPVLFSIIQKGLNSITGTERQTIFAKWIPLEVVNQLDDGQLKQIASISTVIFLGLVFLILILRYQKNKQKSYIEQIHELTYATLMDMRTMNFIWVSHSFSKLSGYTQEELLKMNYLNLTRDWVEDNERKLILAEIFAGKSWKGEYQGETKQGKPYWIELTFTPVRSFFGRYKVVWATRVDITDRKRNERLSITDDLTGLYNRRYFNQIIVQEINRKKRAGTSLCSASLDIDLFKKINDIYGHDHGDEVLKQFAKLLKLTFSRAGDFVFRMGGEEFFILTDFKTEPAFEVYLQKFCEAVAAMGIKNQGSEYGVLTVSMGAVFMHSQDLTDASNLYHELDTCLYEAKAEGRNRVVMSRALVENENDD